MASFVVVAVWLVQLALNVGMMMRVCTCDVAEEKRKDDRTMLIAQRRSRLATPSVTPGGGVGRHTPQAFGAAPPQQQPLGPGQPAQGPPRQYGLPPPAAGRGDVTPPEKKLPSDSDADTSGVAAPPPSYVLPPPQRRMEPSPRRPVDEGPVVVEPAASPQPPAYHQLPPPQVRSPPSKLV